MGMVGVSSRGGYLRSSPVSRQHYILGELMARGAIQVPPGLSLSPLGPHFFFGGTWGSLCITYTLGTDRVRPGHPRPHLSLSPPQGD